MVVEEEVVVVGIVEAWDEVTFTSRDEKRCFMIAIAALWYLQEAWVHVCTSTRRGPKNYDEVLSTTSCGSAARPHSM